MSAPGASDARRHDTLNDVLFAGLDAAGAETPKAPAARRLSRATALYFPALERHLKDLRNDSKTP